MTRRPVAAGGTGGIGSPVARQLHDHGVTVTGRDLDHGADAVRRTAGDGGERR